MPDDETISAPEGEPAAPEKSALSERDKLELQRAYKDAKRKVDDLPNRLRAEYQQAEAEDRKPFPLQPLTTIAAALVLKAIERIEGEPDKSIEVAVRDQRKACSRLAAIEPNIKVSLPAEHLLPILEAAGIGADGA